MTIPATPVTPRSRGVTFTIGQRVEKVGGSSWLGRVVGTYSTTLTPDGYAVESEREPGSVQIYPAKALRAAAEREATRGAEVAALTAEVERLRAALEPFARWAGWYDTMLLPDKYIAHGRRSDEGGDEFIRLSDLRAARAALAGGGA